MAEINSFKPAWWLPGAHLQTIWGTMVRRDVDIELTRERVDLPDGDFIDLVWAGEGDGPIVVVLHGLGGSIESHYAKSIMCQFKQKGWRTVLMHFRGCSGIPNRLDRTYHSGETSDFNYIINLLRKREPNTDFAAVGYSLGGNVLLKWLGEGGHDFLKTAVAVSVPFELHKAATKISQGICRAYQWWFIRFLRQSVLDKFHGRQAPIDLAQVASLRTFWEFDNHVTAPLHGFTGAHHYYATASSRQYIGNIQTPTLVIHSSDDPLMTPDVIPTADELSDSVTLECYKYGGHVGFVSGTIPGHPEYWLDQRIPTHISEYL